mgnify:FL=1
MDVQNDANQSRRDEILHVVVVTDENEEEQNVAYPHNHSLQKSVQNEVHSVVHLVFSKDVRLQLILEVLIARDVLIRDSFVYAYSDK